MKDSIQIVGFGMITEKQAMFEITYFAALMQESYKAGKFTVAMSAMKSMQPFVEALRKKGYSMEQIMPESV